MNFSSFAALMAFAVLSVGCVTPRYGARVEYLGKEYRSSAETNKAVDAVSPEETAQVRVFLGALPDGFELGENGVAPAPGSANRVMGKVSTTSIDGYNPEDAGYCHISRRAAFILCSTSPFTAFLGALACPCIGGHDSNSVEDIELRKAALIAALQRAARASGANAVIINELGGTMMMRKDSRVVVGTQEMTNAAGWAVFLSP
jgi:uncharacterized protein YbjQ (UPF0145 family)